MADLPEVPSGLPGVYQLETTDRALGGVSGVMNAQAQDLMARDRQVLAGFSAATGSTLVGFQQSGAGSVARTTESKLGETISILDKGAVRYDTYEAALAGTDSTAAINAAMLQGRAYVPPGFYRAGGELRITTSGNGLYGFGSKSVIVCPVTRDYPLGVQADVQNVQVSGIRMVGPSDFTGTNMNRAIVFGMSPDWSGLTNTHWDASGCYVDNVDLDGFCVGVHNSRGDGFGFGDIRVVNIGDAREEPGSYGFVNSGKRVTGGTIRVDRGTSTGFRHAVYIVTGSEDVYIDRIFATGSQFSPFQCRVSAAGNNIRFGEMVADQCNLSPSSVAGVANWTTVADAVLATAKNPSFRRIVARNCGGRVVTMRQFPNAVMGDVVIEGHNGAWGSGAGSSDHFLVDLVNSPGAQLPTLVAIQGLDASGLNDATLIPLSLTGSGRTFGGAVQFNGVADTIVRVEASDYVSIERIAAAGTYNRGVNFNNSPGGSVSSLQVDGAYALAARFAGTSNLCNVEGIIPLTAPTTGLYADASSGQKYNRAMRAPGYDVATATADLPDISGFRELLVTYASAGQLTNLLNGAPGQEVTITFQNANTTLVHNANTGGITLRGAVNVVQGTRTVVKLLYHRTSARWLQTS